MIDEAAGCRMHELDDVYVEHCHILRFVSYLMKLSFLTKLRLVRFVFYFFALLKTGRPPFTDLQVTPLVSFRNQ